MLPGMKKRIDTRTAKRSGVRVATEKALRSNLQQFRADGNDCPQTGVQTQPRMESGQSDVIANLRQQINLQEQYMKSQYAMQQQMLKLQQRQLELLESQHVKPVHESPANSASVVPSLNIAGKSQGQAYQVDALYEEPPQEFDDEELEVWKECSGLHTVDEWVSNYMKHPAGWGALLMIQGIPEVTGRLRSKVENYAIYAALFLAISLPAAEAPPISCNGLKDTDWGCVIPKLTYGYAIIAGVICHMFTIFLAMSFVNALNETARNSDVFRMFGRGQGYMATKKCQLAFIFGVLFNFVAMLVGIQDWMGWYGLLISLCMAAVAAKVYRDSAKLLFETSSIVNYWRKDLGGKPDPDDPYDLDVPLQVFKERAQLAHFWKRTADPVQTARTESETETELDESEWTSELADEEETKRLFK